MPWLHKILTLLPCLAGDLVPAEESTSIVRMTSSATRREELSSIWWEHWSTLRAAKRLQDKTCPATPTSTQAKLLGTWMSTGTALSLKMRSATWCNEQVISSLTRMPDLSPRRWTLTEMVSLLKVSLWNRCALRAHPEDIDDKLNSQIEKRYCIILS